MRPLILITNDDGYQACGIQALASVVASFADVYVVAPDGPRSGTACAITCTVPVSFTPIPQPSSPSLLPSLAASSSDSKSEGSQWYACSGTPVDCVKLALEQILPRRPDLILSGINHGDNASISAHYSGTIGAVFEGCMKGIPSVAFSLDSHDAFADFSPLVPWIRRITSYVLEHGLPKGTCLNVNFPATPTYKGLRFCRMAWGEWKNEFERRDHPRGGDYYWLTGKFELEEHTDGFADRIALNEGYVAVTPFKLDATDYALREELEKSFIK